MQIIAHENAKNFLKNWLPMTGATIEFISPPDKEIPEKIPDSIQHPLDPAIFTWEATDGVQEDIQSDGKRSNDTVVLYGVASQFNGCESPAPYTVEPGQAVETYKKDHTQGPQAQLQFDSEQVELLNAAGNIGFNGLVRILDETTKEALFNGYLMPKTKEQALRIIDHLKKKGHQTQYICVANMPNGGSKPVHQILVAAPATGYNRNNIDAATHRNLEFAAALLGFRAQFTQAMRLAEREKKPVVLNAVAVGLGVFKNDPKTVAMAFHQAAVELQNDLANFNRSVKEEDRLDVKVRFQVFRGTDQNALQVVRLTSLNESLS